MTPRASFEAPPGQRAQQPADAKGTVVACALLVVIIVLGHKLIEVGYENGIITSDAGIFATIGLGLAHGHLPYISFWDHKLPGIYLVDALIFKILPANPWSLHVFEFFEALAMAGVFYWASRQIASPRVAAVGTVVFAYLSTLPLFNQTGNLTETYWQLPTVAALGLCLRYLRSAGHGGTLADPDCSGRVKHSTAAVPRTNGNRMPQGSSAAHVGVFNTPLSEPPVQSHPGRHWSVVAAGAMTGVASLFAPQSFSNLAIIAVIVTLQGLRSGSTAAAGATRWTPLALLVAGWALIWVPVMGFFVISAGWAPIFEQVVAYNRAYASAVPLSDLGQFLAAYLNAWIPAIFAWAAIAVCGALAFRRERTRIVALLGLTFLGGIAGAASDRHFYPHDILFAVPGASLLLVCAVEILLARRPAISTAERIACVVPLVLALVILLPQTGHDIRAAFGDAGRLRIVTSFSIAPGPPALQAEHPFPLFQASGLSLVMTPNAATGHQLAAEAIDRLTHSDQYIYMYSPEGGMPFMAGRPPASRFLYNSPLINSFGSALTSSYDSSADRRQLLVDLVRHPPALIAVRAFLRSPRSVRSFPEFEQLLCARYRVRAYVQGFLMYVPHRQTSQERSSCYARFGSR